MKYHKKHCAGQGKGVGGDCRRREKSLFPALCTKGACLVFPKSHGPSMGLGWQPQLRIWEVGEVRVSWRWTCEQGHVQCGSCPVGGLSSRHGFGGSQAMCGQLPAGL